MHYGRHKSTDLLGAWTPALSPVVFRGRGEQTVQPYRTEADQLTWLSIDGGKSSATAIASSGTSESESGDAERAFDRLAQLKVTSSDFAMHLDQAWRAGLFRQLDGILDVEAFDFTDEIPSVASFRTLLRLIIHNRVGRRPGLGATADGRIIATWTEGRDRLTVECLPNDTIRWIAVRYVDGERVSSASVSKVEFLRRFLAPFDPVIWFG